MGERGGVDAEISTGNYPPALKNWTFVSNENEFTYYNNVPIRCVCNQINKQSKLIIFLKKYISLTIAFCRLSLMIRFVKKRKLYFWRICFRK